MYVATRVYLTACMHTGNRSIERLPKTNMRILLSEHPVNKRKEICEMVHVIPNDKTLQDKG